MGSASFGLLAGGAPMGVPESSGAAWLVERRCKTDAGGGPAGGLGTAGTTCGGTVGCLGGGLAGGTAGGFGALS